MKKRFKSATHQPQAKNPCSGCEGVGRGGQLEYPWDLFIEILRQFKAQPVRTLLEF